MVELKCSFEKCGLSIKQGNKEIAIALYQAHIATHTQLVANKVKTRDGEDGVKKKSKKIEVKPLKFLAT